MADQSESKGPSPLIRGQPDAHSHHVQATSANTSMTSIRSWHIDLFTANSLCNVPLDSKSKFRIQMTKVIV